MSISNMGALGLLLAGFSAGIGIGYGFGINQSEIAHEVSGAVSISKKELEALKSKHAEEIEGLEQSYRAAIEKKDEAENKLDIQEREFAELKEIEGLEMTRLRNEIERLRNTVHSCVEN